MLALFTASIPVDDEEEDEDEEDDEEEDDEEDDEEDEEEKEEEISYHSLTMLWLSLPQPHQRSMHHQSK